MDEHDPASLLLQPPLGTVEVGKRETRSGHARGDLQLSLRGVRGREGIVAYKGEEWSCQRQQQEKPGANQASQPRPCSSSCAPSLGSDMPTHMAKRFTPPAA